jgi:hypothetical protein
MFGSKARDWAGMIAWSLLIGGAGSVLLYAWLFGH